MEVFVVKRHFVWILATSVLIELLSLASIILAEEGKWTKRADMPTARNWLSTSVVNGKIYAIGGRAGQTILSTVEVYDTGFAVEAKDKLATSWGKLKARD